jgi:hypothetical protein
MAPAFGSVAQPGARNSAFLPSLGPGFIDWFRLDFACGGVLQKLCHPHRQGAFNSQEQHSKDEFCFRTKTVNPARLRFRYLPDSNFFVSNEFGHFELFRIVNSLEPCSLAA